MMGSRAVMRKGFAPVGPRARLMPVALAVIVGAAVLSANGADAQQPPRRPAPAAQPAGQAPPANAAQPAIPRSGQPGWLGIRVDEWVEDPGAGTTILTVLQVEPGSPAARAGMRIGDRVVRINGLDANTQSLRALTRTLRTGDTVRLQIRRGGSERELAIVAAGRPAYVQPVPAAGIQIFKADSVVRVMRVLLDSMAQSIQRAAPPEFRVVRSDSITTIIVRRSARDMTVDTIRFGPGEADWPGPSVWRQIRFADSARWTPAQFDQLLPMMAIEPERAPHAYAVLTEVGFRSVAGAEFTEMNPGLAAYFDGVTRGLLTLKVAEGTPAARAGLQPGDVIIAVDGRYIGTVFDLRAALARSGEEGLRVELIRKGVRHEIRLAGRR